LDWSSEPAYKHLFFILSIDRADKTDKDKNRPKVIKRGHGGIKVDLEKKLADIEEELKVLLEKMESLEERIDEIVERLDEFEEKISSL